MDLKKRTKHVSYDEIGILKYGALYAQSKIIDRGIVGYIKVRQLYRVLSSSLHVFLSCRIGVFDQFYNFYACAGCSMSLARFRTALVPKNNCRSSLSTIDAVGRPRVVLKLREATVEAVVPVPY